MKKPYYIALILLLPFSCLFFGISIFGILIEEFGIKCQKVGIWYKAVIKNILRELLGGR